MEINQLKTEEAALKDALLKMQALNEGLGQDKIELNRIILQVRGGDLSLADSVNKLKYHESPIQRSWHLKQYIFRNLTCGKKFIVF